MKNIFLESGFVSINKYGEYLCGDYIDTVNTEHSSIIVLSDGLGSGVKANILATLTGRILSTMIAGNMSIDECVYTIAQTLPICKVRQMAYSTFTILQVNKNADAYIAQFDNPEAILLRGGKNYSYPYTRKIICDKEINESNLKLQIGDMLIMITDGVIHAGLGKLMPNGWKRENIIEYLERWYSPDVSPKTMASMIGEACKSLYLEHPDDDATIAVFKIRERQVVNIIIGPPENKEYDEKVLKLFFSKEGKRIVCGGTTAAIVSKYLNARLKMESDSSDPDIPAIGYIKGVDLVTEGVLTIEKVLELARRYTSANCFSTDWKDRKDGASQIARMIFEEATDINFFVGKAVNPTHENPDIPMDMTVKMDIIKKLEGYLELMGKKVKISYC